MKRQNKWSLLVMLLVMLSMIVGQTAQAGTPIRCGQACHTAGRAAPPPLPLPHP